MKFQPVAILRRSCGRSVSGFGVTVSDEKGRVQGWRAFRTGREYFQKRNLFLAESDMVDGSHILFRCESQVSENENLEFLFL